MRQDVWLLVVLIVSSCLGEGGSIGARQQLCWRPYARHFRAPLLILRGGEDGGEDPSAGDAKRFMDSYTPAVYEKMRDDVARTSAYEHALRSLAPNMTVLDIGTGGLALLAISAAKAGARQVYAIEANADAYQQALESVAQCGMSDRITVIHGDSCKVSLPHGARADLIVHEVLGELASIEGVCRVVRDAQLRHISPNPFHRKGRRQISIPSSASSFIAPCEMPDGDYWGSLDPPVILPPGEITTLKLWHFPKRSLLSGWEEMEKLDFESEGGLPEIQSKEIEFEVGRNGILSGFAAYMTACLLRKADGEEGHEIPAIQTWVWDEEAGKEICKGDWAQQVIFLPGGGSEVHAGDIVSLSLKVDTRPMAPCYSLSSRLLSRERQEWEDLGTVTLNKPNFG